MAALIMRAEDARNEARLRTAAHENGALLDATCLYCGGGIRMHDPLVVVDHQGERETSLGREPELAGEPNTMLIHVRCAPQRGK